MQTVVIVCLSLLFAGGIVFWVAMLYISQKEAAKKEADEQAAIKIGNALVEMSTQLAERSLEKQAHTAIWLRLVEVIVSLSSILQEKRVIERQILLNGAQERFLVLQKDFQALMEQKADPASS